jgi:hypothetical protein
MTAGSGSYYETNDPAQLKALFYRSQAGATAESGIRRDLSDLPSLSMEEGETKYGHGRIVRLWRLLRGSEWAGLYSFPLPLEVSQRMKSLCQEENEETSYKIADAIAEWVGDASGAEQTVFTTHVRELSPTGARILFAALSDAEVRIASEWLLHAIAEFLSSDDKRLAQAAAVCLLTSSSALGRTLVQQKLKDPTSLPHAQLIRGIMNLLASE